MAVSHGPYMRVNEVKKKRTRSRSMDVMVAIMQNINRCRQPCYHTKPDNVKRLSSAMSGVNLVRHGPYIPVDKVMIRTTNHIIMVAIDMCNW